MPGYVNHDVWKTRKKNPEIRLAEAINDMISAAMQEVKAKEENEKRTVWTSSWRDTFGDGDLHCGHCGAIIEKDELLRHNWYYCYHCGSKMTNPYGGKTAYGGESETAASDDASGRYMYQTEKEN